MTASTTPALSDLLARHDHRLRELDPLLAESAALPEPGEGEVRLEVDGGVAHALTIRNDPEAFSSIWAALEQHLLRPRVEGPGAMAAVLEAWGGWLDGRATPGSSDAEAMLTWPSRDGAMTPTLRAHGLSPKAILAIRPAGTPTARGETRAVIRPLADDDVEETTRLWMELTEWDNQFLGHPDRPAAAQRFREDLERTDRRWRWVAEHDGALVGMVLVSPPEDAAWVQSAAESTPLAYLGAMVVTAGHRGAGLGAAMVARAHEAVDDAGLPATVLHYAALNPLSGPFWHRSGYRPLLTTWTRPTG